MLLKAMAPKPPMAKRRCRTSRSLYRSPLTPMVGDGSRQPSLPPGQRCPTRSGGLGADGLELPSGEHPVHEAVGDGFGGAEDVVPVGIPTDALDALTGVLSEH